MFHLINITAQIIIICFDLWTLCQYIVGYSKGATCGLTNKS